MQNGTRQSLPKTFRQISPNILGGTQDITSCVDSNNNNNNFIVQPHTYNGFDKCIHKHY